MQEKWKQEQAKRDVRLVVDGAKVQCLLCSNPVGTLKVSYNTPSIQDKLTATIKDKEKLNLLFSGTCMKSPIKCSYGSTDIKIIDCGQRNTFALDAPPSWKRHQKNMQMCNLTK